MTDKLLKIVHLTTVHPWWDNRIYEKMVKPLAQMGHYVTYVAQPSDHMPAASANVDFVPLPRRSGLVGRLQRNLRALFICWSKPGYIIHFHDPEIVIIGLLLRLFGWKVVYDVHEDNLLAIQHKDYLPPVFKMVIKPVVAGMEFLASLSFTLVLAERVYQKRFQRGITVLNYPMFYGNDSLPDEFDGESGVFRCLYTGTISVGRGALNHVRLLHILDDVEIWMVGKCSNELHAELIELAGENKNRLHLVTTEKGVSFDEIRKYYMMGKWGCGLALFPYSPHYYEKELTKFFEYMYYGIPIIASDFPVWSLLLSANNAGITISEEMDKGNLQRCLDAILIIDRVQLKRVAVGKYSWESQLRKLIDIYCMLQF